jgi:hypothetical protein
MMIMVLGFGTIKPATSFERSVALLCMVVAGAVYAYVIGAICSVVTTRDPATAKYQETMDLLKVSPLLAADWCPFVLLLAHSLLYSDHLLQFFTEENDLPVDLRLRIQNYFRHCKQLFRNTLYVRSLARY